jgi:hypothetical protein
LGFSGPCRWTTPLYRLHRNTGAYPDYLLTINKDEAERAVSVYAFKDEGIAGFVATTQTPDTTPLLRLRSNKYGHFYATNVDEASNAVKAFGYIAEGQEGYVWMGPASLAAAQSPATVYKRIAGTKYFAFDPKDPQDSFAAERGYMCVTHNPGCGWVGNKGKDRFFSGIKQLPPRGQAIKL